MTNRGASGQVNFWGFGNTQLAFQVQSEATGYRFVPGVISTTRGTFSVGANNLIYFWPVAIRASVTFDAFAPSVTTTAQAASTFRQAIYRADSSWQPAGLVIESTAIDSSTTGEKVDTCVKTTLTPGRYLLAHRASAASVSCFGATVIWPDITLGASDANALFHQFRWIATSGAYGAFPANPTLGTATTASGQSVCPVVLRSAAP